MSEIKTHYRTCNICEAMCGLEIKYQGNEVISIKPDQEDPFSRGHICPKAVALQDFYHDPDRLRTPLKRTATGWEEIRWDEAFADITANIKRIQAEHGNDAVGIYLGNPNAHNFGNALFLPHFFKAVGSRNRFSSASADQLPHHVASNYMFGAGMAIPVPDIDRTDYMLIIGGNPVVSNGSMMTAAGVPGRIKDIKNRGGKVVVIDPRKTETARIASEHVFIRPEKDALFLLAMINTVISEGLAKLGHLESVVDGLNEVKQACADFPPESVAEVVGINAEKIRQLAREMASAPSAVCYSRMGASTQSFGGLCLWLTNVLNIITGNFDREGGAMFPLPALDLLQRTPKGKPSSYGRFQSRVRQLPYNNSEFPVATLAEEILTEGEGQIRAMFTIAGNPVLSAPGGDNLGKAFAQLDYMVSVDIYLNETTQHANIILPATHGLEVAHYDIFFNSFAVRNTVKFSPPLFEKTGNQMHDWQILKALASHLTGTPEDGSTPELLLEMGLQTGPYKDQGINLQKLKDNPHGIDLGPLKPCLENRIRTADGHIQLAPQIYLDDLARLKDYAASDAERRMEYPFEMIGRRLARSHNTWTQNSQRLVKGRNPCTVLINVEDAERLGITKGQTVVVRSATGHVEMEADVSEDILQGVVSIPQGWGHNRKDTRMTVAATQPGISINTLTDAGRVDPLSGNAAFNGTPVAIEAI
ncbi:dehydrogenase [Hahella sp. CCB-MM4]|uniref:molybdopterin-dependent oxidoreductase n=1 Tax=Hahella sp. (strain CCB-MM4) TaxID=1926491 RepID=UPI000B9A270D|nr:molybdopterin-dependent oxidoreductase [Hahella sp. CCB-MM4]OZG70027.1 dehydrogenase [Hahella sp. CCB-MM4]